MKIVNAFPGGPAESYQLVLVHPDNSRTLVQQTYDFFLPNGTRVQSRTYRDREQRADIYSLEADLSLSRRYLADHPDVEIAKPSRVYIDFETDPTPGFERKHEMRIIVACAVGDDGARFVGVLEEFSDAGEAALLQKFFAFIGAYQCVVAWNGGSSWGQEGFDFVVLRARTERLWPGSSRRLSKWLWLDHLKAYKRLHLMFAETGEERSSYSLDAVSKFVLNEGKHPYDARQTLADWQAGGSRRLTLVNYCEQDTSLLPRIESATGILDLAYEVARLCGCLHDTSGLHPTTFIDSYLLRLAGQRGLRLPTKPKDPPRRKRNFEGAFVFEPSAKGIEKNVFSADFASLYPSIYLMLNASPETKGLPGAVSPMTGLTFAQQPQGIVPAALTELGKLKKSWKDEYKQHPDGSPEYLAAKRTHDAVKSVVNSVYGYMGSEYSRLNDRKISESITLTGQFFTKTVAKEIEARGWRVVQGDTDSVYVHGPTESELRSFLDHANGVLLPGIATAHYCAGPAPKLEFDSAYERMVVVGKKRYIGRYADSEEYIIRGLECRRGDASPLARQLQESCIRKLMIERSEDPEDFPLLLIAARDRILYDELPLEEIVLSESLGKELDDYATTSPAVSAAMVLRSRGEDISRGTKIRFVILDASISPMKVIPASDYTGVCDRWALWERQVFPPTERLLTAAFPETDWTVYGKVRPAKVRENAERKYQAKLEAKDQIRIPGT